MTQQKKYVRKRASIEYPVRRTKQSPREHQLRSTTAWSDPNRRTITFAIIMGGIVLAVLVVLAGYERGSTPPQAAGSASAAADGATIAALQNRLSQNPSDVQALIGLGNSYYDASKWADAIPWYEKALAIVPANADVRTDLGTAYFYSGNSDQAKAQWSKVLEQEPNKIQTHYNLAVLYSHQTPPDLDSASKEWETVIKIDPNSEQAKNAEQNLKSIGKR